MVLKETVFDKFIKFKASFKKDFDDLDEVRFFRMLGKLESWHYPKKRWKDMTLSQEETKVYEWLVLKGYNPSTVYKWYRSLGFNKEIQEKVKNRYLSYNEAKTYSKPFKRLTSLESELMFLIKQKVQQYIVR
ncbi:MAG: hypothetical protein ACLFPQ_00800 [Candidatus Woesearchaeota archaeon]